MIQNGILSRRGRSIFSNKKQTAKKAIDRAISFAIESLEQRRMLSIPAMPSNLAATPNTSSIALTWTNNASDQQGFNIQRSTNDLTWSSIATGVTTTNWTDTTPAAGQIYYYQVDAYNSNGSSVYDTMTVPVATVIASDGFNYSTGAGSNWNGHNTGLGFSSNWTISNASHASIVAGLTYTSGGNQLATSGNAARLTNDQSAVQTLSQSVGTVGSTLWVSFEFNEYSTTTSQAMSAEMDIGTTTNRVALGPQYSGAIDGKVVYGSSTFYVPVSTTVVANTTYFVAYQINYLSSGDVIDLYVNPTPGANAPSPTKTLTLPASAQLATTSAMDIYPNASMTVATFDELRFGSSYASIAPVAPPQSAPAVPTSLTATPAVTSVALSWSNSSTPVVFDVERSTDGTTWTSVATGLTATTWTDTSATAGTTYYYQVEASNAVGSSGYCTPVSTETFVPNVSGLSAAIVSGNIALNWTSSYSGSEFNIQKSVNGGSWTVVATGVTTTSWTDTSTLVSNTTCSYEVQGYVTGAKSAYSSPVTVTTLPTVPSGLSATPGTSNIALTWTNSSGQTGFNIERSTNDSTWSTVAAGITTSSWTDTTTQHYVNYYYQVSASNSAGSSAYSGTAMADVTYVGPYGGTTPTLPGPIEAENYNLGGQGVSYNYPSTNNLGGSYRLDGIGVQSELNTSNGEVLAYTHPGEWVNYTVNVTTTQTYNIDFRVACDNTGSTFHLSVDGTNVTGEVTMPNTGNFQIYQDVVVKDITLSSGTHVLTLTMDHSGGGEYVGNFDSMTILHGLATPANFTVSPVSETSTIMSWSSSPGATGYEIERSTDGGATFQVIATLGATVNQYRDDTLTSSTTAQYNLIATDGIVNSPATATDDATTAASGSDQMWSITLQPGFIGSTGAIDYSTDGGPAASALSLLNGASNSSGVWFASVEADSATDALAQIAQGGLFADTNNLKNAIATLNVDLSDPLAGGYQPGWGVYDNNAGFVIRKDQTTNGQIFRSTDAGLNYDSSTDTYSGWIGVEDLTGNPEESDSDYNDWYWPVSVVPQPSQAPLQDQVGVRSDQQVDIDGVPLPAPSPTGVGESDRIPDTAEEDMYTLTPSYTTTDISVPMPGGDLSLEFRRTEHVDSVTTTNPLMSQDPNANHVWDSQYVLGPGWSTNLSSSLIIHYNPKPSPGQTNYTATVTDDVGNSISYDSNDGVNYSPDVADNFANLSLQATLQPYTDPSTGQTGFMYTEAHGTKLYFLNDVGTIAHSLQANPPTETYYALTKIDDADGNELDYSYGVGDGTLVSSITDHNDSARSLNFAYESVYVNGQTEYRLTSVTGPLSGQVFDYEYSGDLATLSAVVKPSVEAPSSMDSGSPTMYNPEVTFTYDEASYEYVQVYSDGRVIDNHQTITWVLPNTITDANSNSSIGAGDVTHFTYNYTWEPTALALDSNQIVQVAEQKYILSTVQTEDGTATFTEISRGTGSTFGSAVTSVTDTNGNTTTYTFQGAIAAAPNLLGFAVVVDKVTRSVPVTDVDGNTTTATVTYNYSDDINDDLTSVVDVSGNTTTYSYSSGNPSDPYNAQPYGSLFGTYYALHGNPYSQTEGGLTTTYTYDTTFNKLIKETDPAGEVTEYTLDVHGNRTEVINAAGTSAQTTTNYTYASDGFMTSETDPDGRVTDYTQDSNGYLASTTVLGYSGEDMGIVTSRVADIMDNTLASTDADGNTTYITYDNLNRLIDSTPPAVQNPADPSGPLITATTQYFYDANGNLVGQIDQNGNATVYTYDALNRRTSMEQRMVSPTSNNSTYDLVTTYDYDHVGNLTSETDPNGNVTEYKYDALMRKIEMINPTVTVDVDPDSTDPDPETTTVSYVTKYYYGANSGSGAFMFSGFNPTRVVDPNGNATLINYDSAYRAIQAIQGLTGSTETSATGEKDTLTVYNADSKPVQVTVEDASGDVLQNTYTFYNDLQRATVSVVDMTGAALAESPATYTVDNPATFSAPSGDLVTRTTYDGAGHVTSVTDPNGNTTQTIYDGDGRPIETIMPAVTVTSSDGDVSTYSPTTYIVYDANSNVVLTTDANGNQTEFIYDARNRLVQSILDLNGDGTFDPTIGGPDIVTTYGYDLNGNQIYTIDPNGNETDTFYDAANRPIETLGPAVADAADGGTMVRPETITAYDKDGNVISVTDPNDIVTKTSYDQLNRPRFVTQNAAVSLGSADQLVTEMRYDADGNIIAKVKDNWIDGTEQPQVTKYVFNSLNQIVSQTQSAPDGSESETGPTTNFTHDALGNLLSVTDPNGYTTQYIYDRDNRKIEEIDPNPTTGVAGEGPTTTYAYDADSNLIATTVALGYTTEFLYDALNRKVEEIDPDPATGETGDGPTTKYGYDANGNLTNTTDPNGNTTEYVYDRDNRKIETIDPNPTTGAAGGGPTTSYAYDDSGNLIGTTDALGHTTEDTYDALNREVEEIDPNPTTGATGGGPTTLSGYDLDGNLVSLTGARGYTTEYVYDALNREIEEIDPNPMTGATGGGPATSYGYDPVGNQISTTDALGHTTEYFYDALNRQVEEIDPNPSTGAIGGGPTTSYAYDADGNLVSTTDALGHTTEYSYDALNRKIEKIDPNAATGATGGGPTTSYSYDANSNLISTTDALDHTTMYVYDALNRQVEEIDPNPTTGATGGGPTINYAYDADGDLTSTTDALGHTTEYSYDALNRKIEEIDPNPSTGATGGGPTTSYAYDAVGNLVGTTNARGYTTEYVYDALNRQVEEIDPNPTTGATGGGPTTSYGYDAFGNLTSETDARGYTTQYVYDALNWKIEEIDPNPTTGATGGGPTTSYGYDSDGNLISTTDALDHTIEYVYDALNRQVEEIDPNPTTGATGGGPTTSYGYDANGNLISTTNSRDYTTEYVYDALNRQIEEIAPNQSTGATGTGPTTSYGYDANGNMTSMTDAMDQTTTYEYDALNRKIKETDPVPEIPMVAPVTTWQYNGDGNLTGTTDPNGNTTNYVYDALNRQVEVIQASPNGTAARPTTTYAYDANGNLLSDTDPDGNVTSYSYDALNRQISQTNPLDNVSTTEYDSDGNVTSTTDANGQTIQYVYDALDRKTTENWLSTDGGVTRTTSYIYNADGLLTEVSDPDATYSYSYDALNRPTTLSLSIAGLSTPVVLSEAYDADGNQTSLSANVNGTADLLNSYAYDALNELTQIQQTSNGGNSVAPKTVDFGYNADGLMTSQKDYSDGTLAVAGSDSYDHDNRLTGIEYALGSTGSTTLSYSYGYDLGGRMTSQINSDGTTDYTYDNDNQLLSSSLSGESFTYDANGNRISATLGTGTSGTVTTGPDNQVLSDATYNYTYDNNGNLIDEVRKDGTGSTSFTWDDRNRLTEATDYDGSGDVTQTISYTYDDSGNRISQTVKNAAGDITLQEYYIYDSNGNLLLVLDGSGNVKERELTGNQEDQVLASETGVSGSSAGQTQWLLTDNEGSVRDVTDSGGTVVDHIVYDSFGNITSQSDSSNAPRFGYTGQQQDTATGLEYDHARYYDPATGTFLNQDPKGFAAGDQNLYRYVGNNPLTNTDPTGMDDSEDGVGSIIGGANDVGTGTVDLGNGNDGSSSPGDDQQPPNDWYWPGSTPPDNQSPPPADQSPWYWPWSTPPSTSQQGQSPEGTPPPQNVPTPDGTQPPPPNWNAPYPSVAPPWSQQPGQTVRDAMQNFAPPTSNQPTTLPTLDLRGAIAIEQSIARSINSMRQQKAAMESQKEEAARAANFHSYQQHKAQRNYASAHNDIDGQVIASANMEADLLRAGGNEKAAQDVVANAIASARNHAQANRGDEEALAFEAGRDRGYAGGASIIANTLSFGYSDHKGWTQSYQYSEAEFNSSRLASKVALGSFGGAIGLGGLSLGGVTYAGTVAPSEIGVTVQGELINLAYVGTTAGIGGGTYLAANAGQAADNTEEMTSNLMQDSTQLAGSDNLLAAESGGLGGVTKIGPDLAGNPFIENAANIPAQSGYFDLAGHSMNGGTQLLGGVDEGGGLSLGLDEIEQTLTANGWQGEPIRLISCGAGDPALGANAIGAKLSSYLNVPVMAPASDITVFGDSTFSIAPSDTPAGVPYGTPSIENPWTTYGQK